MASKQGTAGRVLLLLAPASYRAGAFLDAARKLGLEVVQGVDIPDELADRWNVPLGLNFGEPDVAIRKIAEYASNMPVDAVLSVDDAATILAAKASEILGLPHNTSESALAARDKGRMRELLLAGGAPVPTFQRYELSHNPVAVAQEVAYPCVLKPLRLSGSRGVIRANDENEFRVAWARLSHLLVAEGNDPATTDILVEEFIPGVEVALEGLLTDGELRVLALFDKPDPLDGPFFEETIYVTPSRLPARTQQEIASSTALAARALGLRTGPIHAELRVNERGPWIVEIAGRSIGGLCSSILQFGTGMALEELILRHAVGMEIGDCTRDEAAAGVMMIPIPGAGLLASVEGVESARQLEGIVDVQITARLHQPLVPLPEGASYLGFIFARASDPYAVEHALRDAHSRLRFSIKPNFSLQTIG